MEGGMATMLICNPHICRVLLGTVRNFGLLYGAVGYWDLPGYAGGRGYMGLLQGIGGTVGYWGVLGSNSGYWSRIYNKMDGS